MALLGATVNNEGRIETQGGAALLGAAQAIRVPLGGSGRIKLELTAGQLNAHVANNKTGTIVTQGGQVYMQAAALQDAVASIVQSGGIDTTGQQGGAVHVLADGGRIKVDGSITANSTGQDEQGQRRAGGDIYIGRDKDANALAAVGDASGAQIESVGGFVETSGAFLKTAGTRVTAKAWLLDPVNITIAASGASGTAYGDSDGATAGVQYNPSTGSIILATDISANLNAGTNVTISTGLAGSAGSDDGNITVNAPIVKSGANNAALTLDANNRVIVNARIGRASADTTSTGNLDVTIVARGNAQTAAQGSAWIGNVIDARAGTVNITGTSLSGWEAVIFQNTSGINAGTYTVRGTNSSTAVRFNGGTATFNSSIGDSLIEGIGGGFGGVFASNGNIINLNTSGSATTTMASGASSTSGVRLGFGGGVTINTNGNVTIGSHNSSSNLFVQATVNVNGGHLSLKGQSAGNGIGLQDGSGTPAQINVNNGSSLTMHGISSGSGNGIDLRPQGVANFITMSGTNAGQRGTLNLIGSSATGAGVYTNAATITSDGGNINLTGSSQGNGLVHDGLVRSGNASGGGVLTLTGTSSSTATPRVGINSSGTVQGGSVVFNGTSAGAQGVYTAGAVTAVVGGVTMTGTSAQGAGVHVQGQVRAVGDIVLSGTSTSVDTQGVIIQNSVESTTGGIVVTGTASSGVQRAVAITANGANNGSLQTAAAGKAINVNADTLFINTLSSVNAGATGTVNVNTTSAGGLINLGGVDTLNSTPSGRVLGLDQGELNRITAGKLVVGGSTSGNITVGAAITTATATGDLELRTAGNIAVNNALTVGATGEKNLTLHASGSSSNIGGTGVIRANELKLLGADHATVALAAASHQINTLAAQVKSLDFKNAKALVIGTAVGIDGVVAKDGVKVVTTTGDLTLNKSVTNSDSGAVTLGAGVASAAGTDSGGDVKTTAGASVSNGNRSVRIHTGSTAGTGDLMHVDASLDTLFYAGTSNTLNAAFNQAEGSSITDGAQYQVLFRQSAAPQLTGGLTGVALEREYNGNTVQASNDLANVKAEMKAHASNSGMFTTTSGANDFAIAKADVIDQLALDASTQAIRNVKRGADQSVEAHGLVLDNAGLSAVGFAFSAAGEPVNTLKITPNTTANVVLTANSATVTYNGGNQTVSGVVATGLLGDDVANNGGASASVSGRNAGTYTNALSDTAQIEANYANVTKNNGALTIDKAQLTLAAVADSRQYDGTNASGQAVVVTGLQGSDAVTASQSFDSKNVGSRTLAVNSGFTIADQNGGNNYTVSTQTASGTISQNTSANVVLTANSATVTYNGGDQTVSGVVATGLLGDDVANNGGASASVSGRNAGTYVNALSDTAQIEANYANVTKNNGALLIDRRSLGVVGTAVADKPFDGQVSAVISRLGVLQGLVEGEDLGLSAQAVFSDAQPGVAKPVTVSYAIANGVNGGSSNYRLSPNPVQVRASIVPLVSNTGMQDMPALGTMGRPRVFVTDAGGSGRAQGLAADQTAPQVCRPIDSGTGDSRIAAEVCTGQR